MDFLESANREIAKGNFWKAKDILFTSVTYAGYRPMVYEKLGKVLLQMQDMSEAGKFLFLSGIWNEAYQIAIGGFLKSTKANRVTFFARFRNLQN